MKPDERERALRALCAELFRAPRGGIAAAAVPVAGPFSLPVHAHADLLQCDLVLGCAGSWEVQGRAVPLRGATAAVFYPGEGHGYGLTGQGPGGEILSLKIRVKRTAPAVRRRIFPAVVRAVPGCEPLARALRRAARLAAVAGRPSAALASATAEVLCLWPGAVAAVPGPHAGAGFDARIEAALRRIEERLAAPAALETLAEQAHLSPRHFARLFHRLCGCTPHAYATVQRLARARELLAQGDLDVTRAAEALGFPDVQSFSRWFRRETGAPPGEFRRRPTLL